jgi:hypothetical protein
MQRRPTCWLNRNALSSRQSDIRHGPAPVPSHHRIQGDDDVFFLIHKQKNVSRSDDTRYGSVIGVLVSAGIDRLQIRQPFAASAFMDAALVVRVDRPDQRLAIVHAAERFASTLRHMTE